MLELVQPRRSAARSGRALADRGHHPPVMRDFRVDPGRVYIAGLSAGGAAAAIMGATYPDLYAAIGVHSGLACGAASDMPSAFAAMRQGAVSALARAPAAARPGRSDHRIPRRPRYHRQPGQRRSGHRPIQGRGGSPNNRHDRARRRADMRYTRTVQADENGRPVLEQWVLHGAGHAWSGGSPAGSYTEPRGPDASREMMRFFLQQPSR